MLTPLDINFISFGIPDAIDVLLVAFIIYRLYKMVKGTAAVNIFIGLALIYVIYIIVQAFDLKLLGSILGKFINIGVIAVMIVFQQEIRKFLLYIGSNEFLKDTLVFLRYSFNLTIQFMIANFNCLFIILLYPIIDSYFILQIKILHFKGSFTNFLFIVDQTFIDIWC